MARTLVALLVVAAFGCRAPKRVVRQPQPAAAPIAEEEAAAPPIARPSWMEQPIERFRSPEWREFFPPPTPRVPPRFAPVDVVTAGQRAALAKTAHGYFVVDAADGISGPHDVGWYESAAFTKASLFVGHPGGGLERLHRLQGGGWSEPEEVEAPPGAIGWAAGRTVLVGRVGANVVVSRDEAATFTKVALHADDPVHGVWARGDEVIVAQTAGSTFTSIDRGKSFARTVHVYGVERFGSWILGSDRTCKGEVVVAALARDGRTWVIVSGLPSPSARLRTENLASLFGASPELVVQPPRAMPWADDVEPPANTLPKFPGSPLCPNRVGTGRRTKTVKMIDVGENIETAPECSGVECIAQQRPPELPPTKTRAYLLHDALCEAKLGAEACAPNAKITRPPHLAFVTDSTAVTNAVRSVRSVAPPSGCVPRFVTFAGGLVLVACDVSAIHVATESGAWTREATFALPNELRFDDFEMLADGTATLTNYRATPRRQWVRRPVEIGVADAWREVRPGAVAYLPRFGGVVDVVIAEPSVGPDAFTLIEDAPGKPPVTVASRVKLGGDLWCLGRRGARVVGLRRKPSGGFERFLLEAGAAVFDGIVLDGRGRLDPNGACGF